MARINTTELIHMVSETAYRTDQVRQDPMVLIAAQRLAQDARATVTSAGQLATSVGVAWVRASEGRPPIAPRSSFNPRPKANPAE